MDLMISNVNQQSKIVTIINKYIKENKMSEMLQDSNPLLANQRIKISPEYQNKIPKTSRFLNPEAV